MLAFLNIQIKIVFLTDCNGDDNWAFDDPPIGGVLINVPTSAEERTSE